MLDFCFDVLCPSTHPRKKRRRNRYPTPFALHHLPRQFPFPSHSLPLTHFRPPEPQYELPRILDPPRSPSPLIGIAEPLPIHLPNLPYTLQGDAYPSDSS